MAAARLPLPTWAPRPNRQPAGTGLAALLRTNSHLGCSTSAPAPALRATAAAARDRRAASTCAEPAGSPSELRHLRGVGPKYVERLREQEVTSVQRLQQLYHEKFLADAEQMQTWLQEVVGIRNSRHCRTMAEHVASLEWRTVKLAVEGNIGAGKSTFLDLMSDSALKMQDIIEVVHEPVDEWRAVRTDAGGPPVNLLEAFYADPKRYAYTFQHYVLLTRMAKDRESRSSTKRMRVLERSIFSDRMVFVRAMHEAGHMGDLELSVYDSWFNMEIQQDSQLVPNGFIYLKANPETCIRRLRHRAREEEVGVSEDYLARLHYMHESWLFTGARQLQFSGVRGPAIYEAESHLERRTAAGLSLSPELASVAQGNNLLMLSPDGFPEAPASIRGSVYMLGGQLPKSNVAGGRDSGASGKEACITAHMKGVPALVLDHDANDIMHDLDARQEYAQKVRDFSDYVQLLSKHKQQAPAHATLSVDRSLSLDDRLSECVARMRKGGMQADAENDVREMLLGMLQGQGTAPQLASRGGR